MPKALDRVIEEYHDAPAVADSLARRSNLPPAISERVVTALSERLQSFLSDAQILELTYVTMTYELHATICRALRLEYDDVEERVVEIPAPGDAASIDVMRGVGREEDT